MTPDQRSIPLSVLLFDADPERRARLQRSLAALPGWILEIAAVSTAGEALERLGRWTADVAFMTQPAGSLDLDLLDRIRQHQPKTRVIVVAAGGSERLAVAAMKRGALDYLAAAELAEANLDGLLRRVVERRFLFDENMELRQVNQLKNEFIANVSHELRTPLSVIIGYAETLRAGSLGPLSDAQNRALGSIVGRAEDLLRTLNQILRIREAHEARPAAALKPLELGAFLGRRACEPTKDLARKRLRLKTQFPGRELWVRADPERLAVVIENLLSNAAKFAPDGSELLLSLSVKDDAALVAVSDQGPGVAPEMLPRLFERFSAASLGPTRDRPGLGLGLPVAKRIIEAHGGRIWLESAPGQGCTALFTLPIADGAQQVPAAGKKRILIVEDNLDIVEVLQLFLSRINEQFDVGTAKSGEEALERLKDGRPDVIILDVMMPGMNGFELIERLRRVPETARIPVLVLTGYADAAQRARELGAGEVLLKPFEKQAFVDKLTRLLGS